MSNAETFLPPQDRLLKTGEAAEQLHISPQTLRDWSDREKIRATVTESGHRQYKQSEVNRVKLAERDITTYWKASVSLALRANGEIVYLRYENNRMVLSNSLAYSLEEVPFEYYNGFNNRWQPDSMLALLTDGATRDELSREAAGAVEINEDGENAALLHLGIIGINKQDILNVVAAETAATIKFMKASFTPKINYDWYTPTGKKLYKD